MANQPSLLQDQNRAPIPLARVKAIALPDSRFVAGTTTSKNGPTELIHQPPARFDAAADQLPSFRQGLVGQFRGTA